MKITRKVKEYCLVLFCSLLIFSCQKDEMKQKSGIAKINIINAVVSDAGLPANAGDIKANISTNVISWKRLPDDQFIGSFQPYRSFLAQTDQSTVLRAVPVIDTTKLWYNKVKQLNSGKVYTLYLSGTPMNVKSLFIEENNVPYAFRSVGKSETAEDSIVNIRFVNLSPSGPKVDINITDRNILEASNLGYQDFTDFKTFSSRNSSISFEIRNTLDRSLIRTYNFNANNNRFKTVAIVLMGIYPIDSSLPASSQYRITVVPY